MLKRGSYARVQKPTSPLLLNSDCDLGMAETLGYTRKEVSEWCQPGIYPAEEQLRDFASELVDLSREARSFPQVARSDVYIDRTFFDEHKWGTLDE
jgi:hypothetical protein